MRDLPDEAIVDTKCFYTGGRGISESERFKKLALPHTIGLIIVSVSLMISYAPRIKGKVHQGHLGE